MIANRERTLAVSSLGWVDHDQLWRLDVRRSVVDRLGLGSGAEYLSVHSSGGDRFAVVHNFRGTRVDITVHGFDEPREVLARVSLSGDGEVVEGNADVWRDVPSLYVSYLAFAPWRDYVLLRVSPGDGRLNVHRLAWYDASYDKDYQSIIGALELPGRNAAVVSVQRSSVLVLHDLSTDQKAGTLNLGGRAGNPELHRRPNGDIWATDYDTVVAVQSNVARVIRRARLQGAAAGTQQFIGGMSFSPDGHTCVVARPFSGDVASLDARTLKMTGIARLGREPLEVVALPEKQVVARDWKTGDLLRGELGPAPPWWKRLW